MTDPILVSTRDELLDVLSKSTGGETILLAGGNYGYLGLGGRNGVTLASKNPDDPAVFSGLGTSNASNIVIDGVVFDYTFAEGDVWYSKPFQVNNAKNIAIRNSVFDGDVAQGVSENQDGFGFAFGLSVRHSEGVTLENNEFFDFRAAMSLTEGKDYSVLGNDVHDIRADGMNVAAVQGIVIEGNHFHDFPLPEGSKDHRDMIQFWTAGTKTPNSDIVIRGNLLDIGDGSQTQSIFMRNELVDTKQAGNEMFYSNITIEENVIINNHLHGITVGETDGLLIRNNTLLRSEGGGAEPLIGVLGTPRINIAKSSINVAVIDNVVSEVVGQDGQPGWVVSDNHFVQDSDPTANNYYNALFVTSSLQALEGVRDLIVLPGSALDQSGAGATITHQGTVAFAARAHVEATNNDPATKVFDAGYSSTDRAPLPDGAYYEWNFGDGTTSIGEKVSHSYVNGGVYAVTLDIVTPDNARARTIVETEVIGRDLLSFHSGKFTAYEPDGAITLPIAPEMDGEAMVLGGGESYAVGRTHIAELLTADEFQIDFGLEATHGASRGEILRIHGSLEISVNGEGELSVLAMLQDSARVRLTTEGADLTNLSAHDISIRFNEGKLEALVDGEVAGEKALPAPILTGGYHGLTFGNIWAGGHFEGKLTSLEISQNASDFPTEPQTEILIGGAPLPPVDEPPVDEPPVDEPPVDEPPVDEPPMDEPPVGEPPMDEPPVGEPPMDEPPMDEPKDETILSLQNGQFFADGEAVGTIRDQGNTSRAGGIALTQFGIAATVSQKYLAAATEADAFGVDLQITAATNLSSGEIMRLHESFVLSVSSSGELHMAYFDASGQHRLIKTDGADIGNGQPHDIGMRYADGRAQVWVDGALLGEGAVENGFNVGQHPLYFGNPWGRGNFEGSIDALNIHLKEVGQSVAEETTTILEFTPEMGFVAYEDGAAIALPHNSQVTAQGLNLGDSGTAATVARAHVSDILDADDFSIGFSLNAETDASKGEVFRVHQSITVSVSNDGALMVDAYGESGARVRLKTEGVDLADGESHDIVVQKGDEQLEVWIDGALHGEAAMAETLSNAGYHALTFGNPWGKGNFDGMLESFEITMEETFDEDDGWQSISMDDNIIPLT